MFNIQKNIAALWQRADFARANVNLNVFNRGALCILVVKVWRVFLQEGADVFARGCAVCARALKPSIRVNGYNARGVAYQVNVAVAAIDARAAVGAILKALTIVSGSGVVTVDDFLAVHWIYLSYFYFVPSLGTIILYHRGYVLSIVFCVKLR